MKKTYRKGGVGAMMDEYERAAGELKRVLEKTSEEDFDRIVDTETKDDDCRSIQTIITHVVGAGYGYADYLREAFSIPSARPKETFRDTAVPVLHREAVEKIDAFLAYTAQTLEGKWEMTDAEIEAVAMKTRWEVMYNLEQLMEHAIVHILRHRRQVERFLERITSP
jgi:uncharacterized damage-inducible protein DinB